MSPSTQQKTENTSPAAGSFADLTIILPTLNEAYTVGDLAKMLLRLYPGAKVLVADDGSTDGTREIVNKLGEAAPVALLDRQGASDHGITASVVDGIEHCSTKYFVVMDADFQHPPQFITAFHDAFRQGHPFCVGVRLPYREEMPKLRFFVSQTSNFLAWFHCRLRGLRVSDPMSGFFGGETAFVRKIIQKAAGRLEPRGYKVLFDLLRSSDRHTPVQEIPYAFATRYGGTSKVATRHGFYFLRSLFR